MINSNLIKKFQKLKLSQNFIRLKNPSVKNVKFFTSKVNQQKTEKKPILNMEQYTTFSKYNQDSSDTLKNKVLEEKEMKKVLIAKVIDNVIYYGAIPIFCAPIIFYGVSGVVDFLYHKFVYYSYQIFLKHIFIVNSVNTGILIGYRLTDEKSEGKVTSLDVYKAIGSRGGDLPGSLHSDQLPAGLHSLQPDIFRGNSWKYFIC